MAAGNGWRIAGPLELLVLQPTPFCNLDCTYCYLPDRDSKHRMSDATLNRVFQFVFSSGIVEQGFTVVWHAGEPMVLPVGYYERAIEIVAAHNPAGLQVGHSFQTNGVLIDDAWCDFFKRHHVNVGVSVDGPAFLHDRNRKTHNGAGTQRRVMEGIRRLQSNEVPFHVISVLTGESLDYADELYDFYLENEIREVAFNIEEIEGPHAASTLGGAEVERRFRRFIGRFFDLVARDELAISVREFDSMVPLILGSDRDDVPLTQENAPCAILSVDCEGNFTTYSPELLGLKSSHYGDFAIGNVTNDTLSSAMNGEKFQRMSNDIARGLSKCRNTCEYYSLCGGGAPVNKYFENGSFDSTETMFCRLNRKVIVDVIVAKLQHPIGVATDGA
ncbi:MAG TPA: cyclophane-forming radical SAM/SPASM peptide maturase GrrM/OscB [Candidatus Binatus sp.]|uniref:cyclophane-forming radical SAM/SPASM peptide maturase GrrM/OscB n=1 Tax=Candidatus Binatus sp. TaxID=2811406 RepID=UPI002B47D661|nr:cyclophane-forming radical SAM/SPASM peptide maturase GrrM/OscB [Candidatus Binatus sp.]HKN13964.1 cyclophane-forming radical SAM/SPASM peptide maturase GrrM/OscB [Candidatus Binatus sp.]